MLTLHTPIVNIQNFNNNMHGQGYTDFTQDFLIKQFDNITVNVTRDDKEVKALTGYDENQDIVTIPQEVVEQVKQDIIESNK